MYELKHTAIDGKTLCGTQNHQSENQPSVHLFSLYECETGLVIGHVVVEKKTNERTGAKAFLKAPFLSGRICTSDAMHTQKNGLQEYMQNRDIAFLLRRKIIEGFIKEEGNFLRIQRMIRANGSTFNSGRKGMEEMSCGKYGQRCSLEPTRAYMERSDVYL
jgi:predicted transposase YbfD/YdcC